MPSGSPCWARGTALLTIRLCPAAGAPRFPNGERSNCVELPVGPRIHLGLDQLIPALAPRPFSYRETCNFPCPASLIRIGRPFVNPKTRPNLDLTLKIESF